MVGVFLSLLKSCWLKDGEGNMENSLFKKWFDIFVVRYTQFYLFELFLATTKLEMSKM